MLLVALLVGLCMPMMAETTSVSFTSSPYPGLTGDVGDSPISYIADIGTGSNNPTTASNSAKYLRLYANNLLTVSAAKGYLIKRITLTVTMDSNNRAYAGGDKKVTSSNGEVTVSTEGNLITLRASVGMRSVYLSHAGGNNDRTRQLRITQIAVEYEEEPVVSQEVKDLLKIQGLVPNVDGTTQYYLKNVGTGLMLSYGGEWGTHCIEQQSAHPIVFEDNGDGTVSIASSLGYLESNTLWFDFPKQCPSKDAEGYEAKFDPWTAGAFVSKWRLVEAEGYEGQYYLVGDYERVLSSVGNKSGLLVLKGKEDKALQRWIVTSGEHIRNILMSNASEELPVDVSVAIRGGAFDLADDHGVTANTPTALEGLLPTYLGYSWTNYTDNGSWVWHRTYRTWNPNEYNCCNIFENLGIDEVVSYEFTLPAGAYRFTMEGFYSHKNDENMNAYVVIKNVDTSKELGKITLPKHDSSKDTGVNFGKSGDVVITSYEHGVNTTPASIFRDNDNYLHEATFYLTNTSKVKISIDRDGLQSNEQVICLDNFNLYYSGYYSTDDLPEEKETMAWIDESTWGAEWNADYLYCWNSETQTWDVYVYIRDDYDGWPYSYQSYVNLCYSEGLIQVSEDQIKYVDSRDEILALKEDADSKYSEYVEKLNGKAPEIQEYLDAADDHLIYKNYLNANIEDYLTKLTSDAAKAKFNELFTVDVYSINSRQDYYDAIAQLEYAYNYAKLQENKSVGGTGYIANPSFEEGTEVVGYVDNNTDKPLLAPKHWNVGLHSWETLVADPTVMDASRFSTQGVDGVCLYNTYWQGSPLTQEVTDLPEGTYLLSALLASGDPGNDGTVYLTANGNGQLYKRGVNPPSEGKVFGDFTKRCLVGSDGKLIVGVRGGNDDDHTVENPTSIGTYSENGHWWYKCDNFRLEYLPDGRLPLRDEDTKIKNLIDPFVGVDVTRSINSGYWSTLVLPFDMPCPTDWEVETLNVVDQYDGDIKLVFGTPTEDEGGGSVLKAGVPYIVRVRTALDKISVNNVNVNTTLLIPATKSSAEYDVEFVPVYTNGFIPASELQKDGNGTLVKENGEYIPTGTQYYFINGSGKLKRCVYENYNAIKGFRAYFKVTPKTAEARNALRSLSMRTSEETDIENVATEEVKVIGIYDVNGIRLSEMKPGINILRMNNGTTKKVMVK